MTNTKAHVQYTISHPADNSRQVSVMLDPTSLVGGYIHLPVIWKGNIDQQPIEIVQTGIYACYDNIEFKQFPEQDYGFLKHDIITWIGEVLQKYN